MPFSTHAKNWMLDQLGITKAKFYSLHTDDPGDTGANEVAGGAPAYARMATAWNLAVGGEKDNSNAPVFNVPAGVTVRYVGLWDAAVGGNYIGHSQIPDTPYAAQGTFTLSDMDMDLNL